VPWPVWLSGRELDQVIALRQRKRYAGTATTNRRAGARDEHDGNARFHMLTVSVAIMLGP
jgi:hypothetical protein